MSEYTVSAEWLTKGEIDTLLHLLMKERNSIRRRKLRPSEKVMAIGLLQQIGEKITSLDAAVRASTKKG